MVSLPGVLAAAAAERSKLLSQTRVRLVLACCVVAPVMFALAIQAQSNAPTDTLFGRSVTDSGFAVPLVTLGFAALWVLPVLASLVGGDVFSAEDRYGTWKTILTRSHSRAEVFAGKVLIALGFSTIALVTLAVSSLAAGLAIVGHQPLIDLSGVALPPDRALLRVALAWVSVLPPTMGITAAAVLASIATRSSAIGIGGPVVATLVMQLSSFVDAPEILRRLLVTSAFRAWHGLFTEPHYYGPLVHGTIVSTTYLVAFLIIAHRMLVHRDIGQ